MEVILLERVAKLGQMGDVVRVKDGFARNYLLRKGKALRATKENRSRFEHMKVELEARNLEQKKEAEKVARKLDGQSFTVLRQAAEGGQLYGSVSPRDLAALVTEAGFAVSRAQVALNAPIKTIGLHRVPISLHPEVEAMISVTVARNADEARRIARGEDITVRARGRKKVARPIFSGARGGECKRSHSARGHAQTCTPRPVAPRYSSNSSPAGWRDGATAAACGGPASAAFPGAGARGRLSASMLSDGRRDLAAALRSFAGAAA